MVKCNFGLNNKFVYMDAFYNAIDVSCLKYKIQVVTHS